MIRTNNPYENKRTKNLLKYKIKDSDEFIELTQTKEFIDARLFIYDTFKQQVGKITKVLFW